MSRRRDARKDRQQDQDEQGHVAERAVAGFVRRALYTVGVGLMIFSAFFVAGMGYELVTGVSDTRPGVLLGLVVFFLGTGVAGVMLARANRTPRRSAPPPGPPPLSKEEARDQCILDLARAERGRVTVEEVAAHCDLGIDEAKQALDRFAVQRVAEMQVSERGILVYLFPGFLSDEEKRRAGRI